MKTDRELFELAEPEPAYEPLEDDPNKAARIAVLRCAAMIGEAME